MRAALTRVPDPGSQILSQDVWIDMSVSHEAELKKGWLKKQARGGLVRNWQTRFFVLDQGRLAYYQHEKHAFPFGDNLKASLDTPFSDTGASVAEHQSGYGDVQLLNARVVEDKRKHTELQIYIQAEGTESDEWRRSLQQHILYAAYAARLGKGVGSSSGTAGGGGGGAAGGPVGRAPSQSGVFGGSSSTGTSTGSGNAAGALTREASIMSRTSNTDMDDPPTPSAGPAEGEVIVPKPAWVIKVLRTNGEKVFVNLCEHPKKQFGEELSAEFKLPKIARKYKGDSNAGVRGVVWSAALARETLGGGAKGGNRSSVCMPAPISHTPPQAQALTPLHTPAPTPAQAQALAAEGPAAAARASGEGPAEAEGPASLSPFSQSNTSNNNNNNNTSGADASPSPAPAQHNISPYGARGSVLLAGPSGPSGPSTTGAAPERRTTISRLFTECEGPGVAGEPLVPRALSEVPARSSNNTSAGGIAMRGAAGASVRGSTLLLGASNNNSLPPHQAYATSNHGNTNASYGAGDAASSSASAGDTGRGSFLEMNEARVKRLVVPFQVVRPNGTIAKTAPDKTSGGRIVANGGKVFVVGRLVLDSQNLVWL
eukprot:gene30292-36604_t